MNKMSKKSKNKYKKAVYVRPHMRRNTKRAGTHMVKGHYRGMGRNDLSAIKGGSFVSERDEHLKEMAELFIYPDDIKKSELKRKMEIDVTEEDGEWHGYITVPIDDFEEEMDIDIDKENERDAKIYMDRLVSNFFDTYFMELATPDRYSREDLVEMCDSRQGWAISGQLESILNGESFDSQNPDALNIIVDFLDEKEEYHLADQVDNYLARAGGH